MTRLLARLGLLLAVASLAASCAAGKAFRRGEAAARVGDLDQAVTHYRTAVQAAPDNPNYMIALQRAMQAASRVHLDKAKEFEDKDQLEAALGEYRLASEFDPSNRVAVAKVAALDRTIRERAEAARPKPPIQQMRERARAATAEPVLNPASREPLNIRFNNANFKDILTFISNATGINVSYDRDVVDRPTTVQLDGVTIEQALSQILSTNALSYKVSSERAILVFPDTLQKHLQYDEQVIKTIYLSNADPTDISQILSAVIRIQGLAIQPAIAVNKTSNSITIRGTANIVQILEKVIEHNDKPRAEVVVDVEILEVDRSRTKQYGLNLSQYALGGIFSPEVSPNLAGAAAGAAATAGRATNPDAVTPTQPFNMNTISRGVSTADFYLAVPTAVVKFLESDNRTKVIAKPQLRGAEGTKLTLKLGQSFPVISTSYTPIATGGAGTNPLNSYNYKDIGVNLEMTPRVTPEGDILLDLTIEDTGVGAQVPIGGASYPSFNQRTVTTRLRLRDGESNLLAGLLQENEATQLQGFPGGIRLPVLKQLFSANTQNIDQTDIVMLLTPHIIRTHEITEADLHPLYIGSQGVTGASLGVGGGPPSLIQGPSEATPSGEAAPPGATVAPPTPATPSYTSLSGVPVTPPPGSSPVPGMVVAPPAQPVPAPLAEAQPAAGAQQLPAAEATPTPPAPVPAAEPPVTSAGVGQAQVTIAAPGTTFRVGGGPYTVPISISGVARLSMITLTLTFDPAVVRVRSVQEGSFMRTGGASVAFDQQTSGGRVDVTIARGADATGATGAGLLAVILFDAVAPGTATLALSGVATGPGGTPMGLQFRPVTITVQQ